MTIHQLNTHVSWLWLMSKDDLILMVVTISLLILWSWYSSTLLSKYSPSLPPGPLHLPILGYLPFLDRNLHTQFTNMAHTYGPIFKVRVGTKLHIVINTPELAKEVVRDQDLTFANRSRTVVASVSTYGGQDIAWSNHNSSWRKLRKIFVHEVLSSKNLEATSCFRRDEIRKTIKNVYSKIGTAIDLNEVFFSTIANVLTSMIWQNSLDNGANYSHLGAELRMLVSEMADLFSIPNMSDFFPSLAWFDLQGVEKEITRVFSKLDGITTRVIDDRIKYNSKLHSNDDEGGGKKDLLQILLDLKDQKNSTSVDITNLDIKALLTDILIAGTETTTSLVEWVMAEIMRNRNVMERVKKELAEIVGPNNIVEESHLSKLKYLDATIKETFRLHPVVPFLVPRSPSENCMVGGYTIPKGCTILLNVWAIHRDPKYWDNPLEFNPQRFLTDHEGKDIKYDFRGNNLKFFPFGSGRRACPGVPLAEKTEMYVLASLLHSFDWTLPKGVDHDFSDIFCVTLRKRKPLVAIPSRRSPSMSLYM